MHDHAAFLASITASPDDDLPRLVYADWLDECGEPGASARAEFIRTQCELERCTPDDDRRMALQKRERQLLKKHSGQWLGELNAAQVMADQDPIDEKRSVWQFRRGFLHSVTVVAQKFPQVAETLFRVAPTVRAVNLCQGSGSVESLIRTPQLARVKELSLSRMCTCGRCPILSELRNLFASPLVANLTHLRLVEDRIDPETMDSLASSPHLSNLQALDLRHNSIGLPGARILASVHGFTELRELNLSENSISASGGQVLARASWLKGLRVLILSRNQLTDTSGRALLKAEFGDTLMRLELKTNELSQEMQKQLKAKYGARVLLK